MRAINLMMAVTSLRTPIEPARPRPAALCMDAESALHSANVMRPVPLLPLKRRGLQRRRMMLRKKERGSRSRC